MLFEYADDLLIMISSRDAHTTKGGIDDLPRKKYLSKLNYFKLLNVSTDLVSTFRYSFLAVIDGKKVIYEENSLDKAIEFSVKCNNHDIKMCSKGFNCTRSDKIPIEISIDGVDYSVNHRGLNIVVWDRRKDKLIDSVCFDTFDNEKVFRN